MLQCLPVNEERMSVLHQDLGGIGNPSPTALEISLDSRDFAQALPSRSCSGIEGGFANHLGGAQQQFKRFHSN